MSLRRRNLSQDDKTVTVKHMNDSIMKVDGATLSAGTLSWHARCVDARLIAGSRWMEIALSGMPSYRVVLKVSPHAGEDDARRALEWWLHTPGRESGDVIEVV